MWKDNGETLRSPPGGTEELTLTMYGAERPELASPEAEVGMEEAALGVAPPHINGIGCFPLIAHFIRMLATPGIT